LRFENSICGSQFVYSRLLNAGIPFNRVRVIYPGVNTNKFLPKAGKNRTDSNGDLKLLYAGSLFVHKGVATAIEALSILVKNGFQRGINLTIIGSGPPAYQEYLKSIVDAHQIEKYVRFFSQLDYEQMPDILPDYDILILPSIYDEPFSRIVLEAMAVGLLVIGTTTGGTQEILVEGETGLTFLPGDSQALAQQVERAINQPELFDRLVHNSRNKVIHEFSLEKMVDEIEDYLECVVKKWN
jgi:glycogen synthase